MFVKRGLLKTNAVNTDVSRMRIIIVGFFLFISSIILVTSCFLIM